MQYLCNVADAAGAADDQHIFDLNVRLQYSDDATVLLQALQVSPLLLLVTHCSCMYTYCLPTP